ncbi:MAG: 4Fe-4S dicluster domain-containing protein [Pseudomonadota bacterium]
MVDGKLDFVFRMSVCQHCDDYTCADACPEEAITKRADGIVIMDDKKCSGWESCMEACPYDAIAFDADKSFARNATPVITGWISGSSPPVPTMSVWLTASISRIQKRLVRPCFNRNRTTNAFFQHPFCILKMRIAADGSYSFAP